MEFEIWVGMYQELSKSGKTSCPESMCASRCVPDNGKTVGEIEEYLEKTGDVLGSYKYMLHWILNFAQDSSGKGVPFDLPYLDFYNRFVTGKEFIDRIFAKASIVMRFKYYRQGFGQVVAKTKNLGHREPGFQKALRQLKYSHKWFNKLRAVLFLEAQMEDEKPLAPLSKKYRLTEQEAQSIPQRLEDFLETVKWELSKCKHPSRKAFLENLQNQVKKYQNNLYVPIIAATINGKKILLVPPRTNNCLESFFRFVKKLLRRCSGRSKLPQEFGSVGALLHYYLSMRDHPMFKEIFKDDGALAEEFAKLFAKQWEPPQNLVYLPQESNWMSDDVVEWVPLWAVEA